MFYHVRHFTLLCLPKGCLLRSNRLSLKKSLEKATEELRRLWKGQLWRERAFWTTLSRHAVLVQSKAQSTAADPVGCAHPAAVVGLLEAGVPKNKMPKLTKSDKKVVKMEPQRESREHFWRPEAQDGRQGGKKNDFGVQKCVPRVPKWVTKGS